MRNGTSLLILLSLGLSCALGCGSGELHFRNDKPQARIPEQPLKPGEMITESFTYGRAVGTPVVAFVVYPRKSLRPARETLVEQLPAYLDALLNGGEDYRGLHFAVMRDITDATPEWFSPDVMGLPRSAWKEASLSFLRSSLSRLAIEHSDSEYDTISPYQSFERIARDVPYRLRKDPGPVWLALNYLRDGDWKVSPDAEDGVRGTLKSLMHMLSLQPVSPFRTSLELMAYLNAGGQCDPLPSRIARSLMAWFGNAGLSFSSEEFCPWFSPDPAVTRAAMTRVGEAIHRQDRKLILQSVPKLETLQVSVAGVIAPRENIIYLGTTNEIAIRQDTVPAPVAGNLIQVQYESKGR